MTLETLNTLMVNPRLVLVLLGVAGLLYWQRQTALDQLREQWRWVAIFGAGAFLGWSYYSQLSPIMEVVPL